MLVVVGFSNSVQEIKDIIVLRNVPEGFKDITEEDVDDLP